jgi:hypothetical protein
MPKKTKNIEVDVNNPKLTPFEKQFVDIWFNMNFKGRLAYKQLKPDVTNESADTRAALILSLQKVKDYIELKQEQIRLKEEVKLDFLVNELKNIVYDINTEDVRAVDENGRVLNKPDYKAKIAAIQTLAKLAGLDNHQKKIDITTNGESLNLKDLIDFKDE